MSVPRKASYVAPQRLSPWKPDQGTTAGWRQPAAVLASTRHSQERIPIISKAGSTRGSWRNISLPFCECEAGPGTSDGSPRPGVAPFLSIKQTCSTPKREPSVSGFLSFCLSPCYIPALTTNKKMQHGLRIYTMPWYISCLSRAALLIKNDCLL